MKRRSPRPDHDLSISWHLPFLGLLASGAMLLFLQWLLGFILQNLDSMNSNMGQVLGQALRSFLQSNGWLILSIVFAPFFFSVVLLFRQICQRFCRELRRPA